MKASNIFGKGLGERKIKPILEKYPDILEDKIVGEQAKKWNASKALEKFINDKKNSSYLKKKTNEQQFNNLTEGMDKTQSGLYYKINKKGNKKKPSKGQSLTCTAKKNY